MSRDLVRGTILWGVLLSTVAFTACDPVLGHNSSTLHFTYSGEDEWSDRSLIRLDVIAWSTHLELDENDMWPRIFDIPGKGTLRATATVVSPRGVELASVTVAFDLQPDYNYGIGTRVSSTRPDGICVGSVSATPLRDDSGSFTGDSLFVSWAGLPERAIC